MTSVHPSYSRDATYDVMGGWLYLWVFTASLLVTNILLELIGILPPFAGEFWAVANDPTSSIYHPFLMPWLLFMLIGRTALLFVAGWLAADFLKKHRRAPMLAIGFLLAYLAVLLVKEFLGMMILKTFEFYVPILFSLDQPWTLLQHKELILAALSCVAWIP